MNIKAFLFLAAFVFAGKLCSQTPPPEAPASPDDSPLITKIGRAGKSMEVAVWPLEGIAGRPLLIAAHGNGGSGPGEIKAWMQLAKTNQFTLVCPTFLSSVHSKFLPDDQRSFPEVLDWMKDHLKYDQDNVFMTGFSGGGYPTWYLATGYPKVFKGLFLQSGNFVGANHLLDLRRWKNKPIRLVWGSKDIPRVIQQNKDALSVLETEQCKEFSFEVIANVGHESHPSLVSAWILETSLKAK